METLVSVLAAPGRAVAATLAPGGRILERAEAGSVQEAVDGLDRASARTVVVEARTRPRAAAVGVVDLLSVDSAIRALSLAGCDVVASVAVNDGREPEERVQRLVEAAPRVILLAGGTDGGDAAHVAGLADVVARARAALEASRGRAPAVVFGGNPDVRDEVVRRLGREVVLVPNVRPSCEHESLDLAVTSVAALAGPGMAGEPASRPAGAARAAAVRDLARLFGGGTLLLHEEGVDGERAEAVSWLGGRWNRADATRGGADGALGLHRARARELSGVPLEREIADAFGRYVPGRDLLDVSPPRLIAGAGGVTAALPPVEAAVRLVTLARPRGFVRLVRANGEDLTLLGLPALLGFSVAREAYGATLEDLGTVAAVDGPAGAVLIRLPWETVTVGPGRMERVPLSRACGAVLEPRGCDLGLGRNQALRVDLPASPAGLLVDARGTPVPPPRRTRVLAR